MRGTGQPLCSQTRTALRQRNWLPAALELWLLLQLNTLLRVRSLPVRMHFGPSDQGYNWVVACLSAGLSK